MLSPIELLSHLLSLLSFNKLPANVPLHHCRLLHLLSIIAGEIQLSEALHWTFIK